ncbi:alkaline-phosphatase-like protein [Scenedesmus sp. NREL 46B-D3]|nr:alkaline-phosphatase-like protein [Scenedesmus sp. NREL 46B-D3]
MKAFFRITIALGLAMAVSAQRQPGAKAHAGKPLNVPFPALEPGQKPNFIVIVTDDQGWDDIGRNNPKYVSTPNLDRFIQDSTFFDNFYVTPQCAQSRAAMLTGRYPARVGTMLVNGAWDFISSHEVTGAKLLASENYATAQFGKWHNSEVQGYEPWSPMVGFQKADIPVSNDGTSNMRLMRTNGTYAKANGDIERVLLAKLARYLNKRDEVGKPFYIYYAPHSIHMLYEKIDGKRQSNQIRFSPPEYRKKYYSDPRLASLKLTNATVDAWAALEYLDDVLGDLFDHLKETGLDKTTYVMVMSDNGAALLRNERASVSMRMPSGMKGDKSTIWEGGIRNFLAVQGPGVQAGVVDSTLLHIIDVLPTVTDLARARKGAAGHLPFDGISFKNLLLPGSGGAASALNARRLCCDICTCRQCAYCAGSCSWQQSSCSSICRKGSRCSCCCNAAAAKAPVAAAPVTKTPAAAATGPPAATAAGGKAPKAAPTPAAGSKKPAPARKSAQAAVDPTIGKVQAPSTGNAVQPPTARKAPGKPAAPSIGSTKKPAARPGSKAGATTEPAAPVPGQRRIVGRGGRAPVIARGDSLATKKQYNRILFFMGPHCWDANAVPLLGPDREVLRPQPLFNFKTGGMINVINGRELPANLKKANPGFEICTAVRHREYKWMGLTDKVYKVAGTHKEQHSTEVTEPMASALRKIMRGAAEKWWQSVIMDRHSLEKPTFYLGLGEGLVSNVLVAGAHDRTAQNIRLIPNGAAGFKAPGDRACFKVMSKGTYDVVLFYTSSAAATIKLSIGTFGSIQSGAAASITATLPAQSRMRGLNIGAMVDLPATGAKPTEACLQLVRSTAPGKSIFNNLANIRFTKRQPWQNTVAAPRRPNQPVSHHGFGAAIDGVSTSSSGNQTSSDAAAPLAVLAPGLDLSHPNNTWLHDVAAPAAGFGVIPDKWEALRMRNAWPDGQGAVFESMYSPYHTEDIGECSICKVEV